MSEEITQYVLDSKHALSQIGSENPKDLNVPNQNIVRIGNLCEVSYLRKLNICFNALTQLEGLDQLPQLKELYAYSNQLQSIEGIKDLNKLEILYLQQNQIKNIDLIFVLLTKLLELRLDRNYLTSIEHIKLSTTLRKLNLSHNQLTTLDGLQGLPNLIELKVSNNQLRNISGLKGFSNLKELDISYNNVKTLDGIQYLPKLEILHAEYNAIIQCQIPVYYNTEKDTRNKSSNASNQTNQTNSKNSNNVLNSNKSATSNTTKGMNRAVNNMLKDSNPFFPTNATNNNKTNKQLPTVDHPILTELYLQHNRIKTFTNLSIYAQTLEILDISFNQIESTAIIYQSCEKLIQLNEIHISGNPCFQRSEDSIDHNDFNIRDQLLFVCPKLTAIDDTMYMAHDASTNLDSQSLNSDMKSRIKDPQLLEQHSEVSNFHTWEKDMENDSLITNKFDEQIEIRKLIQKRKQEEEELIQKKLKEKESKIRQLKGLPKPSESDEESDEEVGKNNVDNTLLPGEEPSQESEEVIDDHIYKPTMTIKSMLTPEQIQEKEEEFRSLLEIAKLKLKTTIFTFENDMNPLFDETPSAEKTKEEELKQQEREKEILEEKNKYLVKEHENTNNLKLLQKLEKYLEQKKSSSISQPSTKEDTKFVRFANANSPLPRPIPPGVTSSANPQVSSHIVTEETHPIMAISNNKPPKMDDPISLSRLNSKQTLDSSSSVSSLPSSSTNNLNTNPIVQLSSGTNVYGSKIHKTEVDYLQKQSNHLLGQGSLSSLLTSSTLSTESDLDLTALKISKPKKAHHFTWDGNNSETKDISTSQSANKETKETKENVHKLDGYSEISEGSTSSPLASSRSQSDGHISKFHVIGFDARKTNFPSSSTTTTITSEADDKQPQPPLQSSVSLPIIDYRIEVEAFKREFDALEHHLTHQKSRPQSATSYAMLTPSSQATSGNFSMNLSSNTSGLMMDGLGSMSISPRYELSTSSTGASSRVIRATSAPSRRKEEALLGPLSSSKSPSLTAMKFHLPNETKESILQSYDSTLSNISENTLSEAPSSTNPQHKLGLNTLESKILALSAKSSKGSSLRRAMDDIGIPSPTLNNFAPFSSAALEIDEQSYFSQPVFRINTPRGQNLDEEEEEENEEGSYGYQSNVYGSGYVDEEEEEENDDEDEEN